MKIRNGFVSNSSSSSFILKLNPVPKTPAELKIILLGKKAPMFLSMYGSSLPTDMVIERIFNDIHGAIQDSPAKKLKKTVTSDDFYITKYNKTEFDRLVDPKFRELFNKYKDQIMESYEALDELYKQDRKDRTQSNSSADYHYGKITAFNQKTTDIIRKSLVMKSEDTDVYVNLTYSDDSGGELDAFIEHSDILKKILVSQISHH